MNGIAIFAASRAAIVALLCLAWTLPGLIGHDPWKPDEAYSFGLVYHMLQSGDWVVPTLAGEPFMEKPPLFYLSAALFAKIFSPLLPLHDGARLATGFYMGLVFLFVACAGRELYGRDHGWIAAAVLLGCVGLLVRAHQLITDIALLAGFAMGIYGLALSLRRPLLAGVWLGSGAGVGFLAKGLIAPGMLGLGALCLFAFPAWRSRNYLRCLALALLAALPGLTLWPYALYQRSPALFEEWLWVNNFGRFLGFVKIGPTADPLFYFTILPWYAWPALPLALWTLWQGGFAALKKPALQLPLALFAVMLTVLSLAADAREVYGLPLLLPLALLAAASVDTLRRGAASALDWFGIMTFGLAAAFLWLGWIALMTGQPQALAARLHEYQPGFEPGFNALAFLLSLVCTVLWLALVSRIGRSNRRAVINWGGGMTLTWMLAMTLWLPFFDAGKSYRSMIASLQSSLPRSYNCMASQTLGEGQRAMLQYFAGIVTRRVEAHPAHGCELLLAQGSAQDAAPPAGNWRKIWEGARPGDNAERYRLYRKR